ncbi:MAG TPA: DNA translocase FtsK, partial [Aggregatilineales bacterium]|nr:DNA translocase FtsK [Aggregatilineales bacterium]
RHLVAGLAKLRDWLLALADRLEPNPLPPPEPAPAVEAEEDDPNKPAIVQLPPIPGRPSIVTGQRGAGAVFVQRRRPNPAEEDLLDLADRPVTRLERLKARLPRGYKVPMRFHLDEVVDSKHTRKRSDKLPPLDIFDARSFERPDDEEINISAALIEETVADFGMSVEVVGVKAGPTVTQYAVSPITHVEVDGELVEQRVRVTRIANLGKDIALALAAPSVRIQAPVPGTSYIGIEVPNSQMGVVSLRPVMESEEFNKIRSPLAVALGREVDGKPYAADLAKMPHLLIGGTTGSGKSVCLRSLATCLVANNRPDQLRLIMIDPKMVELIRFNGLPHLLGRVEVELDRVLGVLRWVTREMDRRYKLMEENHSRNLEIYNRKVHWTKRMPYIVVLIDELAELMTQYPEETEHLITRLAQMARATGIHLVVATQRPSTDVVTGLIKANFPARIAFAVASGTDSRVILDHVGAEELIGKGDMLYQAPEAAAPVRLQGCYVSDVEMERLVDYWRENWEDSDDRVAPWERALSRRLILQETDELIEEAIRVVQQEREASASQLQRKLNVGYPRAGRIIDSLYRLGVVGPERGGGRTREVLIPPDEDPIEFILKRQGKL